MCPLRFHTGLHVYLPARDTFLPVRVVTLMSRKRPRCFENFHENRVTPLHTSRLDEAWTEYVFEAYLKHRSDAGFLAGPPDVSGSRLHSRVHGR